MTATTARSFTASGTAAGGKMQSYTDCLTFHIPSKMAGAVYINRDLAGAGFLVAGAEALADRLADVAVEETAHSVTNGATDNSRDIQNFFLNLAVKLCRKQVECAEE